MKRFISIILSITMVISLLMTSGIVLAKGEDTTFNPTKQSVIINAKSDEPITIRGDGDEDDGTESYDGLLKLKAAKTTIDRDYAQKCMITVKNPTNKVQTVMLEASNEYEDLSVEIIKTGTEENSLFLAPNESKEVELSIFAQNAEHEDYYIPVQAYLMQDDVFVKDASITVEIKCDIPRLNLAWTVISESENTLRKKYEIKNNGDDIADLTISAGEGLENYVQFSPIIQNMEMAAGSTVEITVAPDLAKMKSEGLSYVDGELIGSSGGYSNFQWCSFDTQGQEIHITTMGELVKQQEKNPFSKMETDPESVRLQYYTENGYEEVTDFADIVDENNLIKVKASGDVDLGNGINTNIGLLFETHEAASDAVESDEAEFTVENDKLIITVKSLVTEENYNRLIEIIKEEPQQKVKAKSLSLMSRTSEESGEKEEKLYEFNFGIELDWGLQQVDPFLEEMGKQAPIPFVGYGIARDIAEGAGVVSDFVTGFGIAFNPNLTEEEKTAYYQLTLYNELAYAVSLGLNLLPVYPVKAAYDFVYSNTVGPKIDRMIKLLQAKAEGDWEKYAALYKEIFGQQCTNRGSVGVDFYVPNYTNNKPKVHASSRMYSGGYVNRERTNYDISLNGERVAQTYNTGLTELNQTEIPNENIKPGNNHIVFDYDTSPGSHSVTTETEIQLLYDYDTELGYLGDPEELEDIRPLPDACVYPENIYSSKADVIEGEETDITFKYYNKGPWPGWFTITAYDGDEVVYKDKNHFMAQYSEEEATFKWTPRADSKNIKIVIENTSVRLDEKSEENNTAEKTFNVRKRQSPVIDEIYYGGVYADSPYELKAHIKDAKDVETVEFIIDGKNAAGEKRTSMSEDGSDWEVFLAEKDGLTKGEHTVTVKANYNTSRGQKTVQKSFNIFVDDKEPTEPYFWVSSPDTLLYGDDFKFVVGDADDVRKVSVSFDTGDAIVVKPTAKDYAGTYTVSTKTLSPGIHSASISVQYGKNSNLQELENEYSFELLSEEDSYVVLNLDSAITNPVFYLYENHYQISGNAEKVSEQMYRVKKSQDMLINPENYSVIIKYDDGIIVVPLSENTIKVDASNTNKLTFSNLKEGDSIVSVQVNQIGEKYSSIKLDSASSYQLTPAEYSIAVTTQIDGRKLYNNITVDLTSGDAEIDVSSFVKTFRYKMDGSEADYFDARLYCKNDDVWNNYYIDTDYDVNSHILTCYVTDSYILDQMSKATEVSIVVTSRNEIYVSQVKQAESPKLRLMAVETESTTQEQNVITLKKTDLNRVVVTAEGDNTRVTYTDFNNGVYSERLYGNEYYIPEDSYDLRASVSTGNQSYVAEKQASVSKETEIVLDESTLSVLGNAVVSWDEAYDKEADIRVRKGNKETARVYQAVSGVNIKSEKGASSLYTELSQDSTYFEIESDVNIDKETKIEIEKEFNGSLASYGQLQPGKTITYNIYDVVDSKDNTLQYVSAYNNKLHGYVTYKDADNVKEDIIVPVTAENLTVDTVLPEEGTYYISIMLFTYGIEENHTHNEIIDPGREATCTENGYTEGSHCGLCGEVLKESEQIKALGHSYGEPQFDWQDEENATATFVCSNCGEKIIIPCEIKEKERDKNKGTVTYEATVDYDGKTFKNSKTFTIKEDPEPSETVKPSESPRPSETVKPSESPKPSETVKPSESPKPSETVKPSESLKPSETVKPSESPKPSETVKPSESPKPSETIKPSESPKPVDPVSPDKHADNCPSKPYSDMQDTEGKWFHKGVDYAITQGYMTGVENKLFAPNRAVSRAMVAQILYAAEGKPAVTRSAGFSDVKAGKWYTDAVNWAASKGVVAGYPDGSFKPDKAVTREELATILYKYAQTKTDAFGIAMDALDKFQDKNQIHAYAVNAMEWAVTNKIISGTNLGLEPRGTATRAQLAVMLQAFDKSIRK